jgi:hypothetical protein
MLLEYVLDRTYLTTLPARIVRLGMKDSVRLWSFEGRRAVEFVIE